MDCRETGRKINDFINDTLTPEETEAFISHIRFCPACHEEVEIYYTVRYALDVLDNDRHNGNLDVGSQLERDLQRKEAMIASRHRRNHFFNFTLVIISAILIFMIFLHQFGPRTGTLSQQFVTMVERLF